MNVPRDALEDAAAATLVRISDHLDDDSVDDVLDGIATWLLDTPTYIPPLPGVGREEAIATLMRLRERRLTAGQLRAAIRRQLALVAA